MLKDITLIEDVTRLHESLLDKYEDNWAYNHELLWYGVDGFIHAYLMEKALDVASGKISAEKFIGKYGIELDDIEVRFLQIPRNSISKDGIFIPKRLNSQEKERNVILFFEDYLNLVNTDEWQNKEYANQLIDRVWTPNDLKNESLLKEGKRFGIDLFNFSVQGFRKFKDGYSRDVYEDCPIPPQSKEVNDLGERLIKYYSEIILK